MDAILASLVPPIQSTDKTSAQENNNYTRACNYSYIINVHFIWLHINLVFNIIISILQIRKQIFLVNTCVLFYISGLVKELHPVK